MASKLLKTIAITAQSNQHHVDTKLKSITKWLKTGHTVRVELSGKSDKHKAVEELYQRVEGQTRSGSTINQKVVKGGMIRFVLSPTSEAANLKVNTSDKNEDLPDMIVNKDTSLEDLEKELNASIKDERNKTRKR